MNLKDFQIAMIRYAKLKPSSTTPDFKDHDVASFWFEKLKHIPAGRLGEAMGELISLQYFPCIDDVRKLCGEQNFSDEDIAREFVPALVSAIERFGSPNMEDAKKHLGPVRWGMVEMIGGWNSVCDYDYDEIKNLTAQWRELAIIYLKKNRANKTGGLIEIDRPKNNLTLANSNKIE